MERDQDLSLAEEIELYGTAIEALMHRLSKQASMQFVKLEVTLTDGKWNVSAEDAGTKHDPTDDFADISGDHCCFGTGKTVAEAIAAMKQVY